MKYKIGDHVVIKESNIESVSKYAGKTGVIVGIWDTGDKFPYCVEIDGRGYHIYCSVDRLVDDDKIVITHDGKTTTAKLYRDGETVTATAKCAPEDEFDFMTGAKLAMGRLEEKIKPKYYNGKVVCIKSGHSWFTVGKVYEVVNGVITADDGDKYPKCGHKGYFDAEDVKHAGCLSSSKHNYRNTFIPLVED